MKEQVLPLKTQLEDIAKLPDFLDGLSEAWGVPMELMFNLNLALEEAVTNVIRYAYPDGLVHDFELKAQLEGEELSFILKDEGVPFDPTQVPDADTTLSAEERPIGGLGIFLIRKTMSRMEYQREGNCNILKMTKILN